MSVYAADPYFPPKTKLPYHLPAVTFKNASEKQQVSFDVAHDYMPAIQLPEPLPSYLLSSPRHLTLREAIMLAIRENPNIRSSELQRIVDKFTLILAKEVFQPQYTFKATQSLDHSMKPAYTFTPTVSVKTPLGTQLSVDYANNLDGGSGGATFSVTQPLLKDFGAVNTVPLYDAFNNEAVAKMNFKNNVINSIDAVITAYRTLVSDYKNVEIQKRTLKETLESLKQYQLKVKVGKMAPSDLLQQKATVATTRLALVQQQNALQQNYQQFLSTIGLMPNAQLQIVTDISIDEYPLPTESDAIKRALNNNIAYRQALLQLENTKRAILTAQNQRRWSLNASATATLGQAAKPVGIVDPGTGPTFSLDLEIPIDNVGGQAAEVDARVAYEQAKLALEQQKEDLIRRVMTQLQTIRSDWQQIQVSKTAVTLQAQTLKAAKLKLNYGRSTVFEVTQDQDQLLSQQTALVSTEITYLNDITALHKIWGDTLDVWSIQLRY
ncbi:MAG: TolC family protein [Coxiellaceae bacterium]|nr:TolC family protein [Coxiellaceae bacterium]